MEEQFKTLIALISALVEKYEIAEEDYLPLQEAIEEIYNDVNDEEEVVDEEEVR